MRKLALILSILLAAPVLAGGQRVPVPDLPLTDQHGQTVRLSEQKGIVVLAFMFTTCATLCPVTNAILASLDERLGDDPARDVTILSITLDPATDRPEVLMETARTFEASPRWHFLTGDGATDTAMAFGMSVYDIALHDPVVFVGRGGDGVFMRHPGNPAPDELIASIDRLSVPQ